MNEAKIITRVLDVSRCMDQRYFRSSFDRARSKEPHYNRKYALLIKFN